MHKWNWPSMACRAVWYTGLSVGLAAIGGPRLALGPEESVQSFLDVIAESADRAIDLGVPMSAISTFGGRVVSISASTEEIASSLVQVALWARSSVDEVVLAQLSASVQPLDEFEPYLQTAGSRFTGVNGRRPGKPYACRVLLLADIFRAWHAPLVKSTDAVLDAESDFKDKRMELSPGNLPGLLAWVHEFDSLVAELDQAGIPTSLEANKVRLFRQALPPSPFRTKVDALFEYWEHARTPMEGPAAVAHFLVVAKQLGEKRVRELSRAGKGASGTITGGVAAAGAAAATAVEAVTAAAKLAAATQAAAVIKAAKAAKVAKAAGLRANSATITCFNCGDKGHMSRECPLPQEGRRCYNCKQVGHVASACPARAVTTAGAAGNE